MVEEQQTRKQHPIPQQVLGVEFKIVGDLTLKQFGYLGAFGVLAYAAYAAPLPGILSVALALALFGLGVALALVPIQEQPLDQWIVNLFRAIYAPTRWVWRKTAEPPEFLTAPVPKLAEPTKEKVSPEEAQRRLREYLATLKEEEEIEPVDLAEKQRLEAINLEMQTTIAEIAPPTPPSPVKPPVPTPIQSKIEEKLPREKAKLPPAPPKEPERPPLPKRRFEKAKEVPSLASTINYAAGPILKIQRGPSITYTTPLQNVRAGRKFRPSAETVFAPARERVITTEPPEAVPPILPEAPPEPTPSTPVPTPIPSPPVAKPPKTKRETEPKPTEAEKPLIEAPTPPIPKEPEKPEAPKKRVVKAPSPEKAKPPLVKEANVINGIVYDSKGEVIEGALVAIKLPTEEIRRATKTNQLGQFFFSPLPNGRYLVELPKAKQSFARIEIELTGKESPLLEMRPEKHG
jgi:hypothetical protein